MRLEGESDRTKGVANGEVLAVRLGSYKSCLTILLLIVLLIAMIPIVS